MPTDPNVIQPYPTSPVGTVGTPGIVNSQAPEVNWWNPLSWIAGAAAWLGEHTAGGVLAQPGSRASTKQQQIYKQAQQEQANIPAQAAANPLQAPIEAAKGTLGLGPGLGFFTPDLGVYLALFLLLLLGVWGMISAAKGA